MSWAALGLKLLGVGKWLKANVPWQVWAAIALAIALWLGVRWHAHEVKKTWKAGYDAAKAEDREAAKNLEARINALTVEIATDERKKNDAAVNRISADADDLRLRGPGKAACPSLPKPPAATGGLEPSAVSSRIAPAELPPDDGANPLAAVSWSWLVGTGKQCDLELAENVSWRNWYQRLTQIWPKPPQASSPAHGAAR
jgi:hypothetical protein